jgi:Fe-S-cluster containining protein
MLIPGDAERILAHAPLPQDAALSAQELCRRFFAASEGARVIVQGRAMRIPTIVPAQQPDGRCVFLDASDRCTIHAFAPYGCSHFDIHQSPSEGEARSAAGLLAILNDRGGTYYSLWHFLLRAGCTAAPLRVRRSNLQAMLTPKPLEETRAERPA